MPTLKKDKMVNMTPYIFIIGRRKHAGHHTLVSIAIIVILQFQFLFSIPNIRICN